MANPASSHLDPSHEDTIELSRRIGGAGRLQIMDFMTSVVMRMAAREIDNESPGLTPLDRALKINMLAGADRFTNMSLHDCTQHAPSVGLHEAWLRLKQELNIA